MGVGLLVAALHPQVVVLVCLVVSMGGRSKGPGVVWSVSDERRAAHQKHNATDRFRPRAKTSIPAHSSNRSQAIATSMNWLQVVERSWSKVKDRSLVHSPGGEKRSTARLGVARSNLDRRQLQLQVVSRSQHNFFAGISNERRGWMALKSKWRRVSGALFSGATQHSSKYKSAAKQSKPFNFFL